MRHLLTMFALALAMSSSALAAECPSAFTAPSMTADVTSRLSFLKDHAQTESLRARNWTIGWTITFSSLTVGQLALIPVARNSELAIFKNMTAADLALGAGSSTVGLVTLWLNRLTIMSTGRTYAAKVSAGGGDPCALLVEGESILLQSATQERLGSGPLMHVANGAFNVGVGLIRGFVLKNWTSAITNMLVGGLIGELKILTQPKGSIEAWRRYQAGEVPAVERVSWEVIPSLQGVTIAGTF